MEGTVTISVDEFLELRTKSNAFDQHKIALKYGYDVVLYSEKQEVLDVVKEMQTEYHMDRIEREHELELRYNAKISKLEEEVRVIENLSVADLKALIKIKKRRGY